MRTATGADVCELGPVEQIPLGEGRNFRVAGEEIAVFRTRRGEVFAVQAQCPHRGGPLADGMVGGDTVTCPLHAYTFELSTGEPTRGTCPALRTYEATVSPAGELVVAPAPRRVVCHG